MKRFRANVRFFTDALLFLHPLPVSSKATKWRILYRNGLILYTVALLSTRSVSMQLYLQFSNLQTTVAWFGNVATYLALLANVLITANLIRKADQLSYLSRILSNFQEKVPRRSIWYELSLVANIVRAVSAIVMFGDDLQGLGIVTTVSYQVARIRIEMSLAVLGCSISYLSTVFASINRSLRSRAHSSILVSKRLLTSSFDCIDLINDVWGIFMATCIFLYLIELVQYSMNLRATIVSNGAATIQLYIMSTVACGLYVFSLALFGEKLRIEVRTTINLCNDMVRMVPKVFAIVAHQDVQDQFRILAQHIHQRTNRIDAAGFFTMDHSMILLVASNLCTYLVVACQLA